MTKVDVDVDDMEQIYINVFTTKPRMACFNNITGAETDYEFAPNHSQTAGEYLTDSLGSDSDKLFEDFGALAMKQIPL